ncbi:MAG: hypothetical protein ACRESS_11690 [Stenotrophobium sp.]
MKTKFLAFTAAAMLAGISQFATAAAPAASPVAGIPVLGGLLSGLTSLPSSGAGATGGLAALPVAGPLLAGLAGGGLPGAGSLPGLGSLPGTGALPLPALPALPSLPLGTLAAPLAGVPVIGNVLVVGANNAGPSVPALVNLVVNVVTNLPGLGGSVVALIPTGAGGLPAMPSAASLSGLPTQLQASVTDLLQALNSASAQYGIVPALPTNLLSASAI